MGDRQNSTWGRWRDEVKFSKKISTVQSINIQLRRILLLRCWFLFRPGICRFIIDITYFHANFCFYWFLFYVWFSISFVRSLSQSSISFFLFILSFLEFLIFISYVWEMFHDANQKCLKNVKQLYSNRKKIKNQTTTQREKSKKKENYIGYKFAVRSSGFIYLMCLTAKCFSSYFHEATSKLTVRISMIISRYSFISLLLIMAMRWSCVASVVHGFI